MLTIRESFVFLEYAKGRSQKDIGQEIGITNKTVSVILKSCRRKNIKYGEPEAGELEASAEKYKSSGYNKYLNR